MNSVCFISELMVNNSSQKGFVIEYVMGWLQLLAAYSSIETFTIQNKKNIFEAINLGSPYRFYKTLNFFHLIWLIFKENTYTVIKEYRLFDKMTFSIPP